METDTILESLPTLPTFLTEFHSRAEIQDPKPGPLLRTGILQGTEMILTLSSRPQHANLNTVQASRAGPRTFPFTTRTPLLSYMDLVLATWFNPRPCILGLASVAWAQSFIYLVGTPDTELSKVYLFRFGLASYVPLHHSSRSAYTISSTISDGS